MRITMRFIGVLAAVLLIALPVMGISAQGGARGTVSGQPRDGNGWGDPDDGRGLALRGFRLRARHRGICGHPAPCL